MSHLPPLLPNHQHPSPSDNDNDPDEISPSVALALKLSTLPSDMFDQVLASLAALPYDIWDDDAMKNADINVLQRDMDARRARMTPRDKLETAMLFVEEFDGTRNLRNLNQAIAMMRDAINGFNAEQDTQGRFLGLRQIIPCLARRFKLTGELKDINEVIEALRVAVNIAPDNDVTAEIFYTLGDLLRDRFDSFGEQDDMTESLKAFLKGLSLLPEDDDKHIPLFVKRIAKSLKTCLASPQLIPVFMVTKSELVDGSEAQSKSKRAQILSTLGDDLLEQLLEVGGVQNLDECVDLLRAATDLDPTNANVMTRYGLSRLIRFERLSNSEDLSTALAIQKAAVDLVDETDERLPGILNNLGNVFQTRFEHGGKVVDIDEAVNVHVRALYHSKVKEEERFTFQSSLGTAYHRRFEHLWDLMDLDASVDAKQMAAATVPKDHLYRAQLYASYGGVLLQRYGISRRPEDLEKSLEIQQEAVELTPSTHPARPLRLLNLARTLQDHVLLTKDLRSIEKVISITTEVIPTLVNSNSHRLALARLRLASALRMQYLVNKDTQNDICSDDLDRAVDAARQAVDVLSILPASLDMATVCQELGNCLLARFQEAESPSASDIDEAIAVLQKGAGFPSKPVILQISCAIQAARSCIKFRGVGSGIAAYKTFFELVPKVVWIGNDLHRRYEDIGRIRNVLSEAVAVAIQAEELNLALEWAEQGRCIVWSQILQIRQPVNPALGNLAIEMKSVTSKLQKMGMESKPMIKYPNKLTTTLMSALILHTSKDKPVPIEGMSREEYAHRLAIFPSLLHDANQQEQRRLAEKYENLVIQAQELSGSDGFLRPKRFSELYAITSQGPVVFINVCEERCDAICIVPGQKEAVLIPLENFSEEKATEILSSLIDDLEEKNFRAKSRGYSKLTARTEKICSILGTLWTDVVQPVLLKLEEHLVAENGNLPHVTWCPSGSLSFLPLHAAGIYKDNESCIGQRIFDHVVSSYTPSITALLAAQTQDSTQPIAAPRVLAISQPNTPNEDELSLTVTEVETVQKIHPDLTWLNDTEGTKDAVLMGIREHDWVHFACHGVLNLENPLQSAFLLQDGSLEVADLMKESFHHKKLAYLSACRTAAGSEKLPEESVHLAAGMLMAGFADVVGTLWAIGDDDATFVAEQFYRYLKEEGGGDSRLSSYALHHAIRKQRESIREDEFYRWIPFIHFGV
ncbi:hypothetical protein D9758_011252 [Tetrapyrgos nigripes]|uniref:CHAT domain-containing protein n=1 Tax=Tetrapyrgos nigripes TaxID=182062 RepID=A0A8H5CSZ2_9AGAR|nr:hypothetical protein D9758_011252 [Tetrapyrgos nigripes]